MSIDGKQLRNSSVADTKVDSTVLIASGLHALTGNLSAGTHKITNSADPADPQDLATMAYVDARVNGRDGKESVQAATTAALPANTRVGNVLTANANGALTSASLDTVTPVVGMRILVKNEGGGASHANNGIYILTDIGSAGTPWIMTRATDADVSAEVSNGMFCFVTGGTTAPAGNLGTGWSLLTADPITLNTTPLAFTMTALATVYGAGNGLTISGGNYNVVIGATSGGLTANADDIQVNYGAVGDVVAVDVAAAGAGVSQLLARADHKHTATVGTPGDVGTANAAGSATSLARSDHTHRAPKPSASNKNMVALATTADGNQASSTTMVAANALGGYVAVNLNGVGSIVGDGTKVAVEFYLSGDAGATARAFNAVAAGDTLHFNGSVAGYQLAASDRIDVLYGQF